MLSAIRERATGWIAWIIVILIALPLAATGLYSYFSDSGSAAEVAVVNDTKITPDALNNAYQQERQRLAQMFGGRLDPSLINEDAMRRQVLERMINEALITEYVVKQGYRIPDATLAAIIRGQEVFHENGQFSPELYSVLLRNNGLTPQAYEARLRVGESVSQFQGGVFGSAFATPYEIDQIRRLQNQERDLVYLTVDAESYLKGVEIGEADIKAYYEQNLQRFQRPERVRLAYVELNGEQLADAVEIDEPALQARYEELKASRYTEGGRRQARHILIELPQDATAEQVSAAEAELAQLRQQIVAGELDFAAAAKQHSDDPGSAAAGGDLGWVDRGVMVEPFEKATYALGKGELSGPVRSPYGLHLIEVTDVEPEKVTSFAEARDELRREMAADQVKSQLATLSTRLANLAYEHPDDLETAASELGLEVRRSDWIGANGGVTGIGASPKVREAAFSDEVLRERRNSEVLELEDGRVVVVRVAEHQPAEPLPLAEVAGQIERQLRQERGAALARETGESLRAKLVEGANPAELSKATESVALAEPGFITRNSAEVPPPIVAAAFELPKPDGAASVGATTLPGGDYVVIQLREVRDAQADTEAPQTAELERRLTQAQANATVGDLVSALRKDAKVTINEQRL